MEVAISDLTSGTAWRSGDGDEVGMHRNPPREIVMRRAAGIAWTLITRKPIIRVGVELSLAIGDSLPCLPHSPLPSQVPRILVLELRTNVHTGEAMGA